MRPRTRPFLDHCFAQCMAKELPVLEQVDTVEGKELLLKLGQYRIYRHACMHTCTLHRPGCARSV